MLLLRGSTVYTRLPVLDRNCGRTGIHYSTATITGAPGDRSRPSPRIRWLRPSGSTSVEWLPSLMLTPSDDDYSCAPAIPCERCLPGPRHPESDRREEHSTRPDASRASRSESNKSLELTIALARSLRRQSWQRTSTHGERTGQSLESWSPQAARQPAPHRASARCSTGRDRSSAHTLDCLTASASEGRSFGSIHSMATLPSHLPSRRARPARTSEMAGSSFVVPL